MLDAMRVMSRANLAALEGVLSGVTLGRYRADPDPALLSTGYAQCPATRSTRDHGPVAIRLPVTTTCSEVG